MLYVGIDAASEKHDAIIINSDGVLTTDPFTFKNDLEGYKKLRTEILSHTESINEVRIGIEYTGIYSMNITDYLCSYGFTIYALNPVQTHFFTRATSLRKTKTDKVDSTSICKYIMNFNSDLNPYTKSLYNTEELKSLSRLRFNKMSECSRCKTEFNRLVMLYFPELAQEFSIQSKWVYKLLSLSPTAEKVSRMHLSTLQKIIGVNGDRSKAAVKLQLIAKNSIGKKSAINEILIKNILDDITHITKQITIVDIEIKEIMKEYSYITSIPGIGNTNGAMIVGEIGDINRFASPAQVLAYAGLDPSIYQSGKFLGTKAHITKHGSRYLRTAVFTAARVACIGTGRENAFRTKYQKKRIEGKHHNSALCNISRNIINVIFALMHTKQNYNFSY